MALLYESGAGTPAARGAVARSAVRLIPLKPARKLYLPSMKIPFLPSVLIAIAFAAPALSAAPVTQDGVGLEIAALRERGMVQAVSLGIVHRSGAFTGHFGQLAPTDPAPPDDDTLYEIGSVSKVLTALLLADAVVRGEVSLDTPISRLLPADVVLRDGAGDRITLRMLATHASGLPRIPAEIPADNFTNPYARYGEADLWATLRRLTLEFEPGARAEYSNLAAGLLGTLLARRAGCTYEQLLRERVLDPLGMNRATVRFEDGRLRHLAPPFTADGKACGAWDFTALAGAGGVRATLPDMMRFAQAMLHPADTPLRAAIELAWAPQKLAAPVSPGGQALGWMIAGDRATRWHNGMTGGFHAAIFVNRDEGVAVVWLGNRSHPIGTQMAEKFFRQAAGRAERPIPNAQRAEVALTPEQIDRCVGTYRLNARITLVCERRHLSLFVTPTGQGTDRMFAAAEAVFFSRRAPVELEFELPASGGAATGVTVIQGGRRQRAARE